MISSLNSGEIDVAIALTEGVVTAMLDPTFDVEIISVFIESCLQWGVHISPNNPTTCVEELDPTKIRIAVSRYGSGSHSMAYVFANRMKWDPSQLTFVAVGGLRGALDAFSKNDDLLFLWDRFMTQPVQDDGDMKLIGVQESPWPSFVAVASRKVIENDRDRLTEVLSVVSKLGRGLLDDVEASVALITDRYNLNEATAREWLSCTQYANSPLKADVIPLVRKYLPKIPDQ